MAPCTVIGFITQSHGKYPIDAAVNAVQLNYELFLPLIASYLPEELASFG